MDEKVETHLPEWAIRDFQQAMQFRKKGRDFGGLDYEFLRHQKSMLDKYSKSKDITHNRDVGDYREEILGDFLVNSGLIPGKFGVSNKSARVVSQDGRSTKEIDITLFDPRESITLMKRGKNFEVRALEGTLGVIQVKSNLNKKEVVSAFKNISSYKSQCNVKHNQFGILFSYDCSLKDETLLQHLKKTAENFDGANLPNFVFILKRGIFHWSDGEKKYLLNTDLSEKRNLKIYPEPISSHDYFLCFYYRLMNLLSAASSSPINVGNYGSLPLRAGEHSYEFWPPNTQSAGCKKVGKHGEFPLLISDASMENIQNYISENEPCSPEDLVFKQTNSLEKYIYNPQSENSLELLQYPNGTLSYIHLLIDKKVEFFVPVKYLSDVFLPCPKCLKNFNKKMKKKTTPSKKT